MIADDAMPQVGEHDPRDKRLGLYIHIPFCFTKCTYCDFNTYAGIENMVDEVVDSLDTELRLWCRRPDVAEFSTVFFGGGTPSYIPAPAIKRLLNTARTCAGVSDAAEVTLEANPDDVQPEKLMQWQEAGVNRLSIGVQSFNDPLLESLSRRHSADDALAAISLARDFGFDNISIDLMYGLPNQSLETWTETLKVAIALRLPHLSLYCLQIEPSTPMHQSVLSGSLPTPDDDLAADMYEMAMDYLGDAGYEHYEISNWCFPNMQSDHNLGYWQNSQYIGIGPGAHSHLDGSRFWNVKSPRAYVNAICHACDSSKSAFPDITRGSVAIEDVESISKATRMSETMMLGLRLREGVSLAEFRRRFNLDLQDAYEHEISDIINLGLIEVADNSLRLTRHGRLLGNEVFQRFV